MFLLWIVLLPTLPYDVIMHNLWATSAIPPWLWDLTRVHLSLILCQICSFIRAHLLKFYSILMKLFHPYFNVCFMFSLSLQYQVPVYWSYFDLQRGEEDKWKERQTLMLCSLDCVLHYSFFCESVFVNSRSCGNHLSSRLWFQILISICSSFTDWLIVLFLF